MDAGRAERPEDVDRVGLPECHRRIVVADDDDHRDSGLRQSVDTPCEFALVGHRRIARAIRVTREYDEVNFTVDGTIKCVVETPCEILYTRVQPGRRIKPPVCLDAHMRVGNMQESYRH